MVLPDVILCGKGYTWWGPLLPFGDGQTLIFLSKSVRLIIQYEFVAQERSIGILVLYSLKDRGFWYRF